jgi:hypothetical protein
LVLRYAERLQVPSFDHLDAEEKTARILGTGFPFGFNSSSLAGWVFQSKPQHPMGTVAFAGA